MNGPRRSGPRPDEPSDDGGGWHPSSTYLLAALAIVAGGLLLLAMSPPQPIALAATALEPVPSAAIPTTAHARPRVDRSAAAAAVPVVATASAGASREPQQIPRTRDPDGDQTPDIADYINPGEKPTMGEVIERLHQAGVYGGLGAFSPPGTRPPLVGLAVPENYALPEGYVRHYQATDDGQRIEPILMFSPDVRWPFAIPQDRVVPPELAPPGMPIRRIEIPTPTEPAK